MTKQVVVFPRGQLSAKDRRSLNRAGVCVVEADDPTKIVQVIPVAPLSSNEVLAAALAAMNAGGYQSDICKAFVSQMAKLSQKPPHSSPDP